MKKNYLDDTYEKINDYLIKNDYDVMVVTSYENCYYLSGVFLYYNAVIIGKNKEPILLVKYIDRQLAKNSSLISNIRGYSPYKIENQGDIIIGSYAESIANIIKELGYEKGKICFADFWAVLRPYAELEKLLPEASLIIEEPLLEELRMIKFPHEIEMINKGIKLLDVTLSEISSLIKPGVAECEIAGEIARSIWSRSGELWHAIIASGKNSLLPHSKISNRKLEEKDNVVIDLVASNDTYYAGLTRTFVAGEPTKEQIELYSILLETANHVYSTIRPGMEIGEIARAATNYFDQKGYSKNIRHAFGHAIGTFPHEQPILNTSEKRILKENMVFCFEPGIYVEGIGGFRLGDLIVMTPNGFRMLTENNRSLKPTAIK
ncbi:M24 family metallopeptidase [Clostridium sporogenes]|uniref:M24 family metallopeptidase n=1 Tax=Clostridium sporogenes TaxID=1509 RepID=UPI0006B28C39|nr:Xaa-Pro peptidase family protein [Clostridium sporogenes]KOY65407.1 hypothetical protein AN649_13075 [Clostridium sporogenes]MDS1006664.1 Xaa-Pro peptidase family protein [Clostridium sporogenes]